MCTIAYFEGTDPLVLTRLAIKGIGTLPVSNGWDNHGKNINHITKEDKISAVIGYLHKVIPLQDMAISTKDILFTCNVYNIKVFLVAPEDLIDEAKKLVADAGDNIIIVSPDELCDKLLECNG